ncbi:protein INCA1 [Nycticebus coucang]|uniref:protein INCA1 n=1 Tax=Nycticebus coucang TaxID=9470 RepID=UPI00234DC20C|nr:protein INCA1 [Nycticebus coucang]
MGQCSRIVGPTEWDAGTEIGTPKAEARREMAGLHEPEEQRKHQRGDSLATQLSQVMQVQEDEDNLIPFAKCSRVVSRSLYPALPSQSPRPMAQRYGSVFWESLSQRPCPTWKEEKSIPSMLRITGFSLPGLHSPEGLPPPEMLCRRKRKRPHSEGMQQGAGGIPARVRAVTYHLEDLRRRQRTIDELKKAQWGGSAAAFEPLVLAEEGCGFSSTTEYHDLEGERATYPQEEGHLLTPGRAQLLWSPWSPLGQKACPSRGLHSLASFSTVTASRNPLYNPWGTELASEE